MAENTYNGWTNYETWAVNLWMDNDQGSQEYWREHASEIWIDTDKDRHAAICDLSDRIKDHHDEDIPEQVNGTVYADLLNGALSEINWYEIAEHLIDAAAEDDPVDENEDEEADTDESEARS